MANCSSDVPFLQDDFSELLWDNGPVILQVPRKSPVMNQVEEKKDNEDCSLYPHIPHFEHIESKADMFNSSNDYAIDQWNLPENVDYYSQTDLPNVEKEENIKSVALGSSSKSPMEVTSSFASSAVFEKHNACKGHETILASSGSSAERATIDHYKRKSKNSKRNRAAEVHNLSERRRRDRINEKMRALQELIPNCNKTDKASMLDEAIEYLKSLQMQVQMMSMQRGLYVNPPMMMMHTPMPMFSPINMGIGWAPRCQYVPMAMFGNNNHKIPIPSSKNLERTGHINSKSTN